MLNNELSTQGIANKKVSIYKELPVILINTRDLVKELRIFQGK